MENNFVYEFKNNYAKIDWLSFTIKKMSFENSLLAFGLDETFLEEAVGTAHLGYDKVYKITGTDIFIWRSLEHLDSMGTHYSVSARWLSHWFEHLMAHYEADFTTTWFAFFRYVLENGKFSRVDVACDTDCVDTHFRAFASPSYLYKRYEAGAMVSRVTGKSILKRPDDTVVRYTEAYIIGNKDTGYTFYIGKRKSQICLRIYDKAKEMGDFATFCSRFELEIKDKRANSFVNLMLERGVQRAYIDTLLAFVRFEDTPVWDRFVKKLEQVDRDCVKLSVLCNVVEDFEKAKSTDEEVITYYNKMLSRSVKSWARTHKDAKQIYLEYQEAMWDRYIYGDEVYDEFSPFSFTNFLKNSYSPKDFEFIYLNNS